MGPCCSMQLRAARRQWLKPEEPGSDGATLDFVLGRLTHRGIRRLLTGVDDARHALPRAVVRAAAEEHLAVSHDHGGHPDQRQGSVADMLAQRQDEIRRGYALSLGPAVRDPAAPRALSPGVRRSP